MVSPKPDPSPALLECFGGKKGIKNTLQMFRRQCRILRPSTRNCTHEAPSTCRQHSGLDGNHALAVRHCIERIQEEIEKNLLDLLAIERKKREVRIQRSA